MGFVRIIAVEDGNGDRIALCEFEGRRLIKKVKWWELENGEPVEAACDKSYVIRATGETLRRVA